MSTPNRKSGAGGTIKRQPHKSQESFESGRAHNAAAFAVDFDSDQSSSSLSDSLHPLDELFFHCSQVVSSISSLHETVCGSWKTFLQPTIKTSGSVSHSASIHRNWEKFVESIDKCSEPEVQLLLESQQNIYEMPAIGALSFVRLCQYLVISKFENVEQQMKTENLILIMGSSRRNRRVKKVIFKLLASNSRACRDQMVRTIHYASTNCE